ncbi:hypothetical protein ABW55_06570 [Acinetobacter sp. C15]|uniref:hypothetical protein n=1 Tax=Acinetobacter TaxID=469 RepID=UPI00066025BA|nr:MULTISPECIES: hypothetical protein [Acinetobacter]KOR15880.1 hypothetical protein ABW55_06570 [Acinetobacter sp. C15]MBO3640287.1 hypothetical protein [Acinetobacter soli]MCB8769413.1 hypothetical protein [Acinetobacter soli]WEH89770.1 hypothetical protein PX669_05635 [Acinetobacter soli]WEI10626.1 hypothetical protein PYR73_06850 [Acinetobacter soli]
MKYFKNQSSGEVFAFEDDLIEMTTEEVDRHLNPQNYLTDEEKEQIRLAKFTALTRRQFKLVLLEHDLLNMVEQSIKAIEDKTLRTRIQIEYEESDKFERSNDSVQYMLSILNLTDEQVDEMWRYAMTL